MFVISIVSAAVPPANPFPPTLLRLRPVPEALRSPARPAGSANASPDSVLRHRLRKAFPALRRNTVQSYAIAPNKQSASAKFRTRNRVPQPTKPPPVSGTPPLFAGENSPAATARKNRTIPQTVPRFDPRFSPRGRTAYAAIRQPVSRAHLGHQRSRRAASSASQCSKYSTTWLTT